MRRTVLGLTFLLITPRHDIRHDRHEKRHDLHPVRADRKDLRQVRHP